MARLSKYFINGIIVIAPIAITVFVIVEIFSLADALIGRYLPIQFPGLSFISVLVLIGVVGWLSSSIILKKFLQYGETILSRIPLVKFIYNSSKKISSAVFESQNLFRQAVLVKYPSPDIYALGFIMADVAPSIAEHLDCEHVCVFIPFSLNMTAGVNIIVPKRDIIFLDISNEGALQYILTAGSVMPQKKQ